MSATYDDSKDTGHIARSLEVEASAAWYFLYVLLSTYAHDFMSKSVVGNVHVGLVFGLLQFVSTFAITMAYAHWADTTLDTERERLRDLVEHGEVL